MREVTRTSLVDQAIDQIREGIKSGEWPVGGRIPAENELIEALGVARNTMREAVRALAHAGVLEVRHGDGTYVRARDETQGVLMRRLGLADLLDLLVVRRGLEVEAARQAAERRLPEDVPRLRALARSSVPAEGDGTEQVVAGAMEFHHTVVELSRNPVLIELYSALSSATEAGIRRSTDDLELPDFDHEAHALLVEAIAQGDPARAATEAAHHINIVIDRVRERLRSTP
ncbi:FadR/GntR family transcriptional regulator [Streptomyces caatingaensis]|uniref:HTH gntR-type domain-containing protein n=1 Tax=Streptomyces caatingaensis TaxID=1678637 RepID=A0A0K9XAW2_9ACTN|nr:FadR/GntR family transcriptional regulator [Streptomyces caatingaensis]KNB50560.1 hypothetical protein AC230_21710 [Streptomyces caatingaensis]